MKAEEQVLINEIEDALKLKKSPAPSFARVFELLIRARDRIRELEGQLREAREGLRLVKSE